jgi:hypothetical protein
MLVTIHFKVNFHFLTPVITDVTGPSTATKGIFVIFDIFSYWPQTLQGSDILATHDEEHKYQVFMPDILEGKVAEVPW